MKRAVLLSIVVALFLCSAAMANRVSVIGGIRGGLALGLAVDQLVMEYPNVKVGVEVATGDEGFIMFAEDQFLMTNYGENHPIYLGVGVIGYLGRNSAGGFTVSGIFESPLNDPRMYIEVGADMIPNAAKLQLQTGYRLD
jgi:hypothetical protein